MCVLKFRKPRPGVVVSSACCLSEHQEAALSPALAPDLTAFHSAPCMSAMDPPSQTVSKPPVRVCFHKCLVSFHSNGTVTKTTSNMF